MRLWSLHPGYLDARGLVALWREALLAQAVIRGRTQGYTRHPQLLRFTEQAHPLGFVADYLRAVHAESVGRGYRFAPDKISRSSAASHLDVTRGQVDFEWLHLMKKLRVRDPARHARFATVRVPRLHPLFRRVPGGVAAWEKG